MRGLASGQKPSQAKSVGLELALAWPGLPDSQSQCFEEISAPNIALVVAQQAWKSSFLWWQWLLTTLGQIWPNLEAHCLIWMQILMLPLCVNCSCCPRNYFTTAMNPSVWGSSRFASLQYIQFVTLTPDEPWLRSSQAKATQSQARTSLVLLLLGLGPGMPDSYIILNEKSCSCVTYAIHWSGSQRETVCCPLVLNISLAMLQESEKAFVTLSLTEVLNIWRMWTVRTILTIIQLVQRKRCPQWSRKLSK